MSPAPSTPSLRRPTKQRAAISEALTDSREFRSAQEIHAALEARGAKVGLATVYRNLQAMVDDDEVDVLRTDDGESVYRACSTGHHHHLVCRECGRTVEVDVPQIEAWAAQVARDNGFRDATHIAEIFGTCSDC